jgi:diguanylate cyclase (GGDEF)-like protein/PAS domain S-box-containing protein
MTDRPVSLLLQPLFILRCHGNLFSFVTFAAILALFSHGAAQALPTLQQQKEVLIVGSEQAFPPFATGMTEATAGGFTIDLWQAVAAEIGLRYTLRVRPFHQLLKEFREGKIDLLINLAMSDERHQFADFTVPHVIVNGAIFVRQGERTIHAEDDLVDKSIIVLNADLAHDYAISRGWGSKLVLVDTAAEGLRLLASGEHDAMLLSKLTGLQTLQAQGITGVVPLSVAAGFSQKFAFAVAEGQSILLGQLNEGLALTKSSGLYNTLYEKWFGIYEQGEVGFRHLLHYLVPVTLLFLTIGSYFFYRRQVERATSEATLRTLYTAIEQSPTSVVITDLDAGIQYVNPRFSEVTGYEAREVIGENPRILQSGLMAKEIYLDLWDKLTSGMTWNGEFINRRKDGSTYWEEVHVAPVKSPAGAITHYVAVKSEITERKQAEEKLHLAASVFTHAREGIMITDPEGQIIDVNNAFTRITGYQRDEVLHQTPRLLNSGRQPQEFYAAMWRDLIEHGHWSGEVWNRHKNGEIYAAMQTISAVHDATGVTRQYVALFSDITPLKEHQTQLEYVAHYDALTNLPNRVLLADRLRQAIARTQRREQLLAVAYLDLDGFKEINDTHGHGTGDQLLQTVATRMQQALRDDDSLARLGGDEFVAVLHDLTDIEDCVPMLTRLLTAAAQPVHIGNLVVQVSASLGVTFYPQQEEVDADQLLRQADQAMYQAKLAGKNRYHVFDAAQDRSVRGHHESLEHIRHALSEQQFVLYYQPKVNMRSGAVIGAEALIRWQHPQKGLLPPAVFLPVIEDHPLAVELGEWVIDSALTQMAQWQSTGLTLPVSVNVSARQLQQENFVERLRHLLAQHPQIQPASLELEVLETSALEDLVRVSQIIEACREIGVRFAIDDFGTGYSSLTYLKRLPVNQLKIDQSFVRGMLDDPDDLAILEGVLGLAAAFRRQAIAEGVETLEHGKMLLRLGCELAQGYGIARPMPADQLPAWSAGWKPDPAWHDLPSVSRDDLPLLFAGVEHRAWITGVESHLKGEREAPPSLDHHQCRFGKWMEGDALARYADHPAFLAIEPLHQQVHALARELHTLMAQGNSAEALAGLEALYTLRDRLLQQLDALVQGSRH